MQARPPVIGIPRSPYKAATMMLDPKMHPAQAFAAIAGACLAQLGSNSAGALEGEDPEYIHQMRVALRRLRSALRLFRPHLPVDFATRIGPELGWLTARLGTVRDWDVLLVETLPRLFRAGSNAPVRAGSSEHRLAQAVRLQAAPQRRAAAAALRSRRYRALLQDLAGTIALMQVRPAGKAARGTARATRLLAYAASRLERADLKLRAAPADLHELNPAERHELRIAAKRLRYAVEFFVALFPPKHARRYAQVLADLQTALGTLNDEASALTLLETLPVPAATLASARRRLAACEAATLQEAQAAWTRLTDTPRFWRGKRR